MKKNKLFLQEPTQCLGSCHQLKVPAMRVRTKTCYQMILIGTVLQRAEKWNDYQELFTSYLDAYGAVNHCGSKENEEVGNTSVGHRYEVDNRSSE